MPPPAPGRAGLAGAHRGRQGRAAGGRRGGADRGRAGGAAGRADARDGGRRAGGGGRGWASGSRCTGRCMRLPESHLKYAVGVVLSSFGVFFLGEGLGIDWPGGDVALLYVAATLLAASPGASRARARAGDGLMRALRKLVLGETGRCRSGSRRPRRRRWCCARSAATGGRTTAASSCSRSWWRCCWRRSRPRSAGARPSRLLPSGGYASRPRRPCRGGPRSRRSRCTPRSRRSPRTRCSPGSGCCRRRRRCRRSRPRPCS